MPYLLPSLTSTEGDLLRALPERIDPKSSRARVLLKYGLARVVVDGSFPPEHVFPYMRRTPAGDLYMTATKKKTVKRKTMTKKAPAKKIVAPKDKRSASQRKAGMEHMIPKLVNEKAPKHRKKYCLTTTELTVLASLPDRLSQNGASIRKLVKRRLAMTKSKNPSVGFPWFERTALGDTVLDEDACKPHRKPVRRKKAARKDGKMSTREWLHERAEKKDHFSRAEVEKLVYIVAKTAIEAVTLGMYRSVNSGTCPTSIIMNAHLHNGLTNEAMASSIADSLTSLILVADGFEKVSKEACSFGG